MFGPVFGRRAEYEIVALEPDDAATVAAIHAGAFARAWSDGEFASLLSQPTVFGFLAAMPGRPRQDAAGFVLVRAAAGEAEILSIGVLPRMRRSGLGWRLMQAALREAAGRGAEEMFLEVDETNQPATALYGRLGFARVGERRAYYEHAGSSRTAALVMRRDLSGRQM